MTKVEFIYFDIGGVLVDWKDAFKTVSTKFNLQFSDLIHIWDIYNDQITRGKITPQQFWNFCRKELGIKKGEVFDFLESWVSDYKPIYEMHNFVKELSKRYKVGLLTNLYLGMLPKLLKKQLIPNIDYHSVIASCDVGYRKPEIEIYEIATKKSGVIPSEILLVDDREDFLEGARKCGWQSALFELGNSDISIEKIKRILKE